LVDDFEDGNGETAANDGRFGYWFTFNDMTAAGMQTPADDLPSAPTGSGNASSYAYQTAGEGFSEWGAGMGVNVSQPGTSPCPYNASACDGVSFLFRSNADVTFKVTTAATVPAAGGGTCTDGCYDPHGKTIVASADWTTVEVKFSELVQGGFGTPAAFDPAAMIALQWTVAADVAFDFGIDDVELTGCVASAEME
jgi:hypothetical protein